MGTLKRYGKLFRIRPELLAEYRRAHDEIWPEMAQAIRSSGIRNYSLYERPDGTIFSYFEAADAAASSAFMAAQPVNARWQKAMEPYFARRETGIVGPEIEDLEEVFHLD
jgi:L-rhamnose mutarotase